MHKAYVMSGAMPLWFVTRHKTIKDYSPTLLPIWRDAAILVPVPE